LSVIIRLENKILSKIRQNVTMINDVLGKRVQKINIIIKSIDMYSMNIKVMNFLWTMRVIKKNKIGITHKVLTTRHYF